MWDFNGEDDASRCGCKGPDSFAALIKILSALYKGEEEEFLRVNPRGGFSMYNPPSWVSRHFRSPISFMFPYLSIQSSNFDAGATPDCKGDKQPSSTTRGPGTVPRPGLPRGPGLRRGADPWGVSSIEQGQRLGDHYGRLSRTTPSLSSNRDRSPNTLKMIHPCLFLIIVYQWRLCRGGPRGRRPSLRQLANKGPRGPAG